MNKFWYVALNEYKRHVFRKSYLFAILSVPLILFVSIGVGYLVEVFENNPDPVGYVDLSGVLASPQPVPEGAGTRDPVEIIAFEDEAAALAASGTPGPPLEWSCFVQIGRCPRTTPKVCPRTSAQSANLFSNKVLVVGQEQRQHKGYHADDNTAE